jgi:hypothetical protein
MERTITIKTSDGKQAGSGIAAQGQRGDTELAHVNPWEEMLLKALGGAGTVNPRTGLRQFYNPLLDFSTEKIRRKGIETTTDPLPLTDMSTVPTDMFNFPLNIAPYSGSTSQGTSQSSNTSSNLATNQAESASNNQSTSQGKTYSGLPAQYQEMLLQAIMPMLLQQTTNMPQNLDQYTGEALGAYQQMMNNALKQNIPTAIANLANRGILNSTEGQKILGNVYSSAATDAAGKGYQTAMQAALAKANMPTILSQIAQLGQTSLGENQAQSTGTSSSTSTGRSEGSSYGSSTGSTSGNSFSTDPTQMYQIMANMIMAMM